MKDINRVVIPVDTSDVSRVAAEQGAFFAKLLNVDVSIIAVDDTGQYMISAMLENRVGQQKQLVLEEIKQLTKEHGVNATAQLISGTPASEIVKFVKDDDLIIMASKGKKGFSKFLLGSVSEQVLKNAPCAVMIIKEKVNKQAMEFLPNQTKKEEKKE